MVKGRFSGGYASGYWSYFYERPVKSSSRYYRAEDQKLSGMIENGKVGKWTYWYENGSKKMMGTYRDNKKNGDWIFWHQNSLNILKEDICKMNFKESGNSGMQMEIFKKVAILSKAK